MRRSLVSTSKFLSLVLRHAPERIGLQLDQHGWTSVEELLRRAAQAGHPITIEVLWQVVETNDKRRFALSPDGLRIRASQGHSVSVDLALPPTQPPDPLYHGTARRNLDSIRELGLLAGRRRHVHLSTDPQTALGVGARHGSPLVLIVDARAMHDQAFEFFLSENGVWLTERVPAAFLRLQRDGPPLGTDARR